MRTILLFLLLSISATHLVAQNECRATLTNVLHKMRSTKGMDQLHVNYVITLYSDDQPMSSDTVNIYTSPDRSRIVASGSEVFQNEAMILSMLKDQHVAYVQDSKGRESDFDYFKSSSIIQDSILSTAKDIICESACVDNNKNVDRDTYTVISNDSMKEYLSLNRLIYTIDPNTELLTEINYQYVDGHNPSSMTVKILEYNKAYSADVFDNKEPSKILANLQSGEVNYEIIDLREEKNK